ASGRLCDSLSRRAVDCCVALLRAFRLGSLVLMCAITYDILGHQAESLLPRFVFVWLALFFFFSSRRRHTRLVSDWSSDVCSSDLKPLGAGWGACSRSLAPPGKELPGFESSERLIDPCSDASVAAGLVEARQELQLRFGRLTARHLEFECEGIAAMPEQQVAGPGEHAHTLEAHGLAYVARAAVCRVKPQHIGLGAQAQVIADSSVYRGLRTLTTLPVHDTGLPRKKSGMSGAPAPGLATAVIR